MKKLTAVLVLTLLSVKPALADMQDADYIDLAVNISRLHIIPAYKNLEIDALAFSENTSENCSADAVNIIEIRKSYHQLMDSWQAVQHIRFGPIMADNRYHRIQFWPDKKNLTSKHLSKFIKQFDTVKLEKDTFAKSSIAIQGMGALERVLYTDKYTASMQQGGAQGQFICIYLATIGSNIATIAATTQTEWDVETGGYLEEITTAGNGSSTYLDAEELIVEFYAPLTTGVKTIWDLKLKRPLASYDNPKPKRAESWRSERSLRNIRVNILALFHLFDTGFTPLLEDQGLESLSSQIEYEFLSALGQHSIIEKPITQLVVDDDGRQQLLQLWGSVFSLQETINVDLADALEIPQGFNALDGD